MIVTDLLFSLAYATVVAVVGHRIHVGIACRRRQHPPACSVLAQLALPPPPPPLNTRKVHHAHAVPSCKPNFTTPAKNLHLHTLYTWTHCMYDLCECVCVSVLEFLSMFSQHSTSNNDDTLPPPPPPSRGDKTWRHSYVIDPSG